jgi:hypothetical protein
MPQSSTASTRERRTAFRFPISGQGKLRSMGKRGPKRSLTAADKAAAQRLRAIWDSIPKNERISQTAIGEMFPGDKGSQSLVSQYLLGRIALNYLAVKIFARALNVPETAIRTDLPEQSLNRSSAEFGGEKNSPRVLPASSHLPGISVPILDQAFEYFEHDEDQAGRFPTHIARVERLAELYRRIEAEGGQLSKAGILRIGEEIERRRGINERSEKQGSKPHRGKH